MRILLVTGSCPPMKCGVGDYSYNLAKSLSADPHYRIGILTSDCVENAGTVDGIEIFPIMKKWNLTGVLTVVRLIRSWSPDVVHIQQPTQGYGKGQLHWILPLVCFVMGRKVVETWHGAYGLEYTPKLILKAVVPGGLIYVHPHFIEDYHPLLRWVFLNKHCAFVPNASAIPKANLNELEIHDLRKHYIKNQKRLIVFFGFVYPHKGVELVFDIANSGSDQFVIAGEIDEHGEYGQQLLQRSSAEEWQGKVTITGFLSVSDVASLLTVADAVVLPFRRGGGEWNTSIHGTVMQGTFVVTTSLTRNGYDNQNNVYYANPDDIQEMRQALDMYAGVKNAVSPGAYEDEWEQIAEAHRRVYEK